jgi:prepilin-type N-terminal cleavage/methylation domain-containing protein
MTSANPNQDGFSLLEVLIATAILASLSVMLLPTLRGAVQAEARASLLLEERAGHAVMEEVLRDVLRFSHSLPGGGDGQGFRGGAGGFTAIIRAPGELQSSQASLSLSGDSLVMRLSPLSDQAGEPRETVLASGLSEARFYYFGDRDTRNAPVWRTEWEHKIPPRMVVLDMAGPDGALRRIEIAVSARADFACRFDSGLGICLANEVDIVDDTLAADPGVDPVTQVQQIQAEPRDSRPRRTCTADAQGRSNCAGGG